MDFKAPEELWNPLSKNYLVNFRGLAGIGNTTVYKTKPIFTGLRHGKLSKFLTLRCDLIALQWIFFSNILVDTPMLVHGQGMGYPLWDQSL